MKRNFVILSRLKLRTLKQRLIFLLTMSTMVSVIFTTVISYNAIISIQQNKVNTSISSTLERFTAQLDRDYYNLLQITQQMIPQGHVGSDVDDFFF